AFEWLNKSFNAGLPAGQAAQIGSDPNLASLGNDVRFKEVMVLADKLSWPCAYLPEHRQFDFWVGEWDVQPSSGQPNAGQSVATSIIQGIVGSCIIYENYASGPYSGKSFNFYDANLKKWRQTWVDSVGSISEFAGEFKDGAMRYEGESHRPDGTKI